MVDRGDDVEFELAVGAGEEDAGVDFYLFCAGSVEGFEDGYHAGLFARPGGAVYQKMREVAGVGL